MRLQKHGAPELRADRWRSSRKSPCIDVCALDGTTRRCLGCYTRDEIRG
ncbi:MULTISPECIES: DUF1289 domain-containing protein [Paraburkholderia]|uniref:DUF1289 domain-containing protein n=1 Tax=Paraburkholderia podalyriae TaxID=1938811 RepID=A0ABR7Q191_9BURK|nr:DUF1289 domain-containing protein [Paraburkholderia podalyriae]MBC8752268.1 DUF1289 domain-containing protein [Paraburkholderia podalyriae]